jgi:glycosyltransferase involved in cell wall biosynthesis
MKILQIGSYPQDASIIKGGVQASCYGLTQALIRQGHEVAVITVPSKDIKCDSTVEEGRLSVCYLSNKYKYDSLNILYFKKIIGLIKSEKADAVHFHTYDLLRLALLIYCRIKRCNVILTAHGILFLEHLKKVKIRPSVVNILKLCLYSSIEFIALNLCRKIIVDTEYVRRELTKITRRALCVIPQGIDSAMFDLYDKCDEKQLLSVGMISRRKGHEYTLKAIKRVKRQHPEVKLTIAGILSADNVPYYKMLLKITEENQLQDNVNFIINASSEEIKRLYETANIFLLHSAEESQGIVFCEAMAAGKPVVATCSGGIPDVVKSGINGLLSAYGNVEIFAENLLKIMDNKDLRTSMSQQNRIEARKYNWDIIAKNVADLYFSQK